MAAFDFDGTLTDGPSLMAFLRAAGGTPALAGAVLLELPRVALAGIAPRHGRDLAKEHLIGRVLGGREIDDVRRLGETFAKELLQRRLRPEMARRVEWHRSNGHAVLIVSASPDVYVEPAGRALGIPDIVCTLLEVGDDGRLTGRFASPNCRGKQKASRLLSWIGDDQPVKLWAYGNSAADEDMLRIADVAVRVGKRPVPDLP